MVIICNKKVITEEIGQLIVSAIITLLSVQFAYDLAYNPDCKQALEFLQEKFLGVMLDSSRKITTAYSNLFRAVNCSEQKLKDKESEVAESSQPTDEDATQGFCDY